MSEMPTKIINSNCPVDIHLIFLRQDLAREIKAVKYYMEAAYAIGGELGQLFFHEALDEATHVVMLMRLLAKYDPLQGEEFRNRGLNLISEAVSPPNEVKRKKDISREKIIEYLSEAVDFELETINRYQRQIEVSTNSEIADQLCHIMNHEKDDTAVFAKKLFEYTNWGIS